MKVTTADRLKEIMATRKLRQVDILNMCQPFCQKYDVKLQKNDLSQYISGKYTPSQTKLTILGLALNVSESWLMGYDVPMGRYTKTSSADLTEDEAELVELYRSVPDDKKVLCLQMIKTALQV